MSSIFIVLIVLLAGAVLTYFADKVAGVARDIVFLGTIVTATVWFFMNVPIGETTSMNLGGLTLSFGLSSFSYLFSIIVLGLGFFAAFYAIPYMHGKEKLGYFYMNFILSIFGMMGIILAKDLVSLFIFWEIMTWSSYLITIYNGNDVQRIGIKYMIFSALGAYAMLMAIVLSYAFTGSMTIDALVVGFTSMPHMYQIMIPILLLTGFGVKAAMMPLHVWAPGAYSNAPMAFTGVFSGALSKMGVYGMVLVFVTLIPHLPEASLLRTIFAWLGGITAAMATVWAVLQDDAKKLLAYSSVAQLGYIIVGVAVGTPLAMMAALFLAVMHALFKGTLFFAAGAVERQAGTTDMTKVTGLIRKMPWTFLASLISIIALAGIPPLGGFVGKWFLYESLITGSNYLLVIVIFFSSTAAFLYAYRFLFGLFLGQEEEEYAHVKEAPLLMVLPMLILAGGSVFLGAFPGYLFKIIENGLISINYPIPTVKWWEMSTILNGWGDTVNLMYVWYSVVVVFVFFLLYIILKGRKNTRYVSTKEISTSGEIPRPHESLNFKLDFYKPFERAIEPMLRGNMDKYWTSFGKGLEAFFDFTRRLYSGNGQTYAIYVITFLVILLLFGRSWFGL